MFVTNIRTTITPPMIYPIDPSTKPVPKNGVGVRELLRQFHNAERKKT